MAENIPTNNIDHLQYVVPSCSKFAFERISKKRFTNVRSELKTRKAAEIDRISNKLLKAAGLTYPSY